jgi:hypothetical protein
MWPCCGNPGNAQLEQITIMFAGPDPEAPNAVWEGMTKAIQATAMMMQIVIVLLRLVLVLTVTLLSLVCVSADRIQRNMVVC